jgi:hypothetical protein
MRTTIDIDTDVLQTAKEIARKEKRTAGQVISEFARRGFYGAESDVVESTASYTTKNGVPTLPPTGSLVTEETIRGIRDTEGI